MGIVEMAERAVRGRAGLPLTLAECDREIAALKHQVADLERAILEVMEERDVAQDWADKLAYAIAPQEHIGEHSSANNPWASALDSLDGERQSHDRETQTVLRALYAACRDGWADGDSAAESYLEAARSA